MSKLMMLVAAKWRDFCTENPDLVEGLEEEKKSSTPVSRQEDEDVEDDDEEDSKSSSRKGSRRSSRKGGRSSVPSSSKSKTKVPTLKIRIGKRKRGSSVRSEAVAIR
jgi:chromodomain-helicase-DNA-binding protein 4